VHLCGILTYAVYVMPALPCNTQHGFREVDAFTVKSMLFKQFELITRTTADIKNRPVAVLLYQGDHSVSDRTYKRKKKLVIKFSCISILFHFST